MSPERSNAYQRVMHTLDELGPSKLQSGEQDRVRYAADNLIFASSLAGEASLALADALELCTSLVAERTLGAGHRRPARRRHQRLRPGARAGRRRPSRLAAHAVASASERRIGFRHSVARSTN